MKYVLIAATMLTASLTFAQPQKEQRTPEERAKMQSERLATDLGLSADQQAKIYEINLKELKEAEVVRNDAQLTEEAKKEKMKAIFDARKTAYDQVLTDEQQKKLAERRPMVREDRPDRPDRKMDLTPEQRATSMTDKMATDLSLTEEQKKKVYDLNLSHAKKADEIRSNTALSEDEKKSQMDALRASEKGQYKSVLTKDQLAKLKEMREKEGHGPKDHKDQKNRKKGN